MQSSTTHLPIQVPFVPTNLFYQLDSNSNSVPTKPLSNFGMDASLMGHSGQDPSQLLTSTHTAPIQCHKGFGEALHPTKCFFLPLLDLIILAHEIFLKTITKFSKFTKPSPFHMEVSALLMAVKQVEYMRIDKCRFFTDSKLLVDTFDPVRK